MNGVYEVTLPGAVRFPGDPEPVSSIIHVTTATMATVSAGCRYSCVDGIAVPVPVADVVTLPESGDQSAVTVRMCYPFSTLCRGSIIGDGHPYANGGWMEGPVESAPAVNPKIAKLFLNAWGNMCGGEE